MELTNLEKQVKEYLKAGKGKGYLEIPRWLDALDLSNNTKIIYCLLLERFEYSKLIDELGEKYIIFEELDMAERSNTSESTTKRTYSLLSKIGLIEISPSSTSRANIIKVVDLGKILTQELENVNDDIKDFNEEANNQNEFSKEILEDEPKKEYTQNTVKSMVIQNEPLNSFLKPKNINSKKKKASQKISYSLEKVKGIYERKNLTFDLEEYFETMCMIDWEDKNGNEIANLVGHMKAWQNRQEERARKREEHQKVMEENNNFNMHDLPLVPEKCIRVKFDEQGNIINANDLINKDLENELINTIPRRRKIVV